MPNFALKVYISKADLVIINALFPFPHSFISQKISASCTACDLLYHAADNQEPIQDSPAPSAPAALTTTVAPAATTANSKQAASSSQQTNGHLDSTDQTQNGDAQEAAVASDTADGEAVSVKNLIKRRSSSAEVSLTALVSLCHLFQEQCMQ